MARGQPVRVRLEVRVGPGLVSRQPIRRVVGEQVGDKVVESAPIGGIYGARKIWIKMKKNIKKYIF